MTTCKPLIFALFFLFIFTNDALANGYKCQTPSGCSGRIVAGGVQYEFIYENDDIIYLGDGWEDTQHPSSIDDSKFPNPFPGFSSDLTYQAAPAPEMFYCSLEEGCLLESLLFKNGAKVIDSFHAEEGAELELIGKFQPIN